MITLSPNQLHILQHSLGCDKYGQTDYRGTDENDGCGVYPRNRYVADPDIDLSILVAEGYMEDRGAIRVYGDMHYFVVTPAGMAAMKAASPKPPKLTAGQKRYRQFLSEECGESFGEWLKRQKNQPRDELRGVSV